MASSVVVQTISKVTTVDIVVTIEAQGKSVNMTALQLTKFGAIEGFNLKDIVDVEIQIARYIQIFGQPPHIGYHVTAPDEIKYRIKEVVLREDTLHITVI